MAELIPQPVSAGDLEAQLAELKRSRPHGSQSMFAPDSSSWKVNRESALFLAAARAALLQLAHPWVATAIAQHSRTLDDPLARFHQTFRVMFTMVFGTVEQALTEARHLHRLHQTIRGQLSHSFGRYRVGMPYEANEVSALLWVYATLVDSALLAYELLLPSLGNAEREQYYAESRQTAALFGLSRENLPPDGSSFRLYMTSALHSDTLGVGDATREMAHRLLDGAGLKVRPPLWYRALTTELLPPRFRAEFQLTYTERERRSAAAALRWLRRIYPHLPAAIRFVGPYNEVQSRLDGIHRPGLTVRVSNRFWIGQTSLFGSPHSVKEKLQNAS